MHFYKQFASWRDAVRATRKKLTLTQQQIARITGISQSRISEIENGQTDPKLSEVEKINEALGLALVLTSESYLAEVDLTLWECELIEKIEDRPPTIPESILGDRLRHG